MAVYGIDMGHNLNAGASKILNETTENRKIGNRLIAMLEEKGDKVVNCTNDNANNQLGGIVQKANAQVLDLFVSIHLNAGGGHGTETYTYSTTSSAREKAQAVNDAIVASCGFRNRGLKTAPYYVLKNTIAPAMLIEVCFVDSAEDASKLDCEKVARAIFKGITGTEYKEEPKEYRVKITADVLNVRAGAGTGYKVTTQVKQNDVYTIVETVGNWGKLKSGAGYICLDYTVRC